METVNARKNESNPKIYVACMAAFNAGTQHGSWIAANQPAEVIEKEILEMLSESPVPGSQEHAIHDYENFGSFHLARYDDIKTVSALAQIIDEFGEMVASKVWGHTGGDADKIMLLLQCWREVGAATSH